MSGKKRRKNSLERQQKRTAYLLVLPLVIGLALFFLPMLAQTFWFSVNNLTITGEGYTLAFAGGENYRQAVFVNPNFTDQLISSIKGLATDLPATLVLSLFVAILLNLRFRGVTAVKAIFFIPVLLATGIIMKVENTTGILETVQNISAVETGTDMDTANFTQITAILKGVNLSPTITNLVIAAADRIYTVLNSCGVQIFIFLAALQTIPASLHEAASVEGCTGWEFFWKITLPMISPIVMVNGVYTVVDIFTRSTNPFFTFTNRVAFGDNQFGVSMAMLTLYLGIVAAILGLVYLVFRKTIYYEN